MDVLALRMQQSSLQFSDSPAQQRKDISDLFDKGQRYPIKTGTEAGADNANHDWLIEYAREYRHLLHFARDCWVAVSRAIVEAGSFERGEVFIADNDETWGRGHDTVMATVGFDHADPRIGHVSVGSVHYPVRGAQPGDVNYPITLRASRLLSRWLTQAGSGSALAFVNGDFNVNDLRFDFDLGVGNFTSLGDLLDRHPDTGHGPIDGMCKYDRDRRVTARSLQVLDDDELFQHSDHNVYRGVWAVRSL